MLDVRDVMPSEYVCLAEEPELKFGRLAQAVQVGVGGGFRTREKPASTARARSSRARADEPGLLAFSE